MPQDKVVTISIDVPEALAEFIKLAESSRRYMFVISYMNPFVPGRMEHARTIVDFPVGSILPALEHHKEEMTDNIIRPNQQGITKVMVDKADDVPKIVALPVDKKDVDGGWV